MPGLTMAIGSNDQSEDLAQRQAAVLLETPIEQQDSETKVPGMTLNKGVNVTVSKNFIKRVKNRLWAAALRALTRTAKRL
jgi:hypothetical protein